MSAERVRPVRTCRRGAVPSASSLCIGSASCAGAALCSSVKLAWAAMSYHPQSLTSHVEACWNASSWLLLREGLVDDGRLTAARPWPAAPDVSIMAEGRPHARAREVH
jgi:hypothetical protein